MTSALMPTYARADAAFERGEGPYIFSEAGDRYLDFGAGIAVCALGHAHPHLVEALTTQARKLWHTSNLYEISGQGRLAERLVAATFADRVFFTNSGAEAVECGLKLIRKYHDETGNPERFRVITVEGAFHGRTLATIAAGGQDKLLNGFGPAVEGFDQVPFGDIDAMRAAIGPETAAILIEPVQGEGGIRPIEPAFLRQVRALCDEHGLLLMLDEIQCGIGRTGKLFAYEWAEIEPDVMAIAKGIGGGFPVGACLATEKAAVGMTAGTHGTTFGGNPLAMAVGNAVLDVVLEDGFLDRVQRIANHLSQQLAGVVDRHGEVFEEVRGQGLMLGLKCKVPNIDVWNKLRDNGLLSVPAGDNVVRLLPPLIIDEQQIGEAVDILDKSAGELES
ncbi:MAG: aspartate aminotransferase family protein [Minwuiales bacterium]|nr:aspartate aminotransferase family protein [Minwuiales bacterium]